MATVELEAGGYHYAEYGEPSGIAADAVAWDASDRSTWAGIAPERIRGQRTG
jgi:hypothetical protein